MAKKQKEKLFEEVVFQDIEKAKREVKFAKINQVRILIGFGLSLIATVFTALSLWGNPENHYTFLGLAGVLAIPSYLIGGGIFKALGVAWKITKISWVLIPVFPVDIIIAIFCFFVSFYACLFVPVIFVGINYIQHKRTLAAAKSYLELCGMMVENATAKE